MTASSWRDVSLVAVDIGNTRTKIGGFHAEALRQPMPVPNVTLELATDSLQLSIGGGGTAGLPSSAGAEGITAGQGNSATQHCGSNSARSELEALVASEPLQWVIGSVHRSAANGLCQWIASSRNQDSVQRLTHQSIPMPLEVDVPERVGIDRLLACYAANRLRDQSRAAIVVTVGTAITVNLVTASGAFAGGAILPGLHLAAQALGQGTDALPIVAQTTAGNAPNACGKNTEAAIASGLYWGAVGAVRELVARIGDGNAPSCNLFFTGGDAQTLANAVDPHANYQAELVLSGAALVANAKPATGEAS